jgi:hypothetical protein
MAGHRKRSGRPVRRVTRAKAHHQRIASCLTAEQQLAVVYDYFRSTVSRMAPGRRADILNTVSRYLADLAGQAQSEAHRASLPANPRSAPPAEPVAAGFALPEDRPAWVPPPADSWWLTS